MKQLKLISLTFLFSIGLSAKEIKTFDRASIIKIEIGHEYESGRDSKNYKRDLEKRIYLLEKAVRQLQEKVFDLEFENYSLKDDKKKFTCYIKTAFDGVFTSTKVSKTEAKVDVMKACSEKTQSSVRCSESEVKCDNE